MDGTYLLVIIFAALLLTVCVRWVLNRRSSKRFFNHIQLQIEKAVTIQARELGKTTNLGYWEHMASLEQHQLEDDKIAELQKQLRSRRKQK